jgi:hypothetical protein
MQILISWMIWFGASRMRLCKICVARTLPVFHSGKEIS